MWWVYFHLFIFHDLEMFASSLVPLGPVLYSNHTPVTVGTSHGHCGNYNNKLSDCHGNIRDG